MEQVSVLDMSIRFLSPARTDASLATELPYGRWSRAGGTG